MDSSKILSKTSSEIKTPSRAKNINDDNKNAKTKVLAKNSIKVNNNEENSKKVVNKVEKKDCPLKNFLVKYRTTETSQSTHWNFINSTGFKYKIPSSENNKFWDLYLDYISKKKKLYIAEKTDTLIPVFLEFNFKFELSKGTNQKFREEHKEDIIKIIYKIVKDLFEKTSQKTFFSVFLERQTSFVFEGFLNHGFMIMFPYCITEKWILKDVIKSRVLEEVIENNIFHNIEFNIDEMIEDNINTVPLYGSVKIKNSKPYVFVYAMGEDQHPIPLKEMFTKKVRHNDEDSYTDFEDETNISYDKTKNLEYYLPMFLSVRGKKISTLIKYDKKHIVKKEKNHSPTKDLFTKKPIDEVLTDLKVAEEMMKFISPKRAANKYELVEMGKVLFNVSSGLDKGLELWIEFARKYKGYKTGLCEDVWENLIFTDYHLPTLHTWAKTDNPDQYKKWRDVQIADTVEKAICGTQFAIASILYEMYKYDYKCVTTKQKTSWYRFHSHRWEQSEGVELTNKIPTEIVDKFNQILRKIITDSMNSPDASEKQTMNEKVKAIAKIIGSLQQITNTNGIMSFCRNLFFDPNFEYKLDANQKLLAFKNGIYDCENDAFRPGTPDDYVTKSTGRRYREYNDDDEEMEDLNDFLKKIFVDIKLRKYFIRLCASCIQGGNLHKTLPLWIGNADGGKSTVQELFMMAFGEYAIALPVTVFTGQRAQSGAATPELAKLDGVRVMFTDEPSGKEKIHSGMLRAMVGGDKMPVRKLYGDLKNITPQHKSFMLTNDFVGTDSVEEAVMKKIRQIPFESVFADPRERYVPNTEEEQMEKKIFPIDREFKRKLPKLAPAFMFLLLKEYKLYKKHGLSEPDRVKTATRDYVKQNDPVIQFIDEFVEKCDDEKGEGIGIQDFYTRYKNWFSEEYENQKHMNRGELRMYLNKKWGMPRGKNNKWEGYKFIETS